MTAGNKGDGRPEEVISQTNHIFLYSSGEADIEEETAGYKGRVEGQKKPSPRSINFTCAPQGSCEIALNKRQPDTRDVRKDVVIAPLTIATNGKVNTEHVATLGRKRRPDK